MICSTYVEKHWLVYKYIRIILFYSREVKINIIVKFKVTCGLSWFSTILSRSG